MGDTGAVLEVDVLAGRETVAAVLTRLEAQLERSDATAQRLAAALEAKLARGQGAAKNGADALYQAEVRLRVAQGDLAGAIGLVEQHLAGLEKGSLAATRTQTQLTQLQTKLANESKGVGDFLKNAGSSALSFASGLGIATSAGAAITGVLNKIKEGFDLRAKLDEQRRTLGALFGDVERGNKVFAEAADFGKKFGFTQKEMGQAAQEAALLIKNSTASAGKLLEVLARLSSLNPEQGISGAALALKELQAGQITSIVNRFNLSRDAANQMKQAIAGGADAVDVLDQQLAKLGVTADILAQRTQGAAGAERTYAQAQENLSLAMGRFAEGPGKAVIQTLADITNNIARATSKSADVQQFGVQAAQGAKSFEDYGARIQFVNQQLAGIGEHIVPLTQAQYNYARGVAATGTAWDQAIAKAQAMNPVLVQVGQVQEQVRRTGDLTAPALDRLANSMLRTAESGPEGVAAVASLTAAYHAGGITAAQFQQALDNLAQQHQVVAQAAQQEAFMQEFRAGEQLGGATATQQNTQATEEQTQALLDHLQQTQQSTQQTEQFSAAQQTLAALGGAVAGGLTTAGQAALALADQYHIAYGEALNLINAQAALAKEKVSIQAQVDFRAGERSGGEFRSEADQARAADARRAQARLTDEAAAAEDRYNRSIGNLSPVRARLNEELRLAKTRGDKAGVFDAMTALKELDQQQDRLDKKGRARSKGAGATKLSDAQQLSNKLIANEEKTNNQLEDLDLKHTKNLLKIERDYAEKSLAQQRTNERDKRRSRADFYSSISDLDAASQQQLSAEYEQAYAESQRIAQAGNHKLSADYLKMRQDQIAADRDYLAKRKEIEDNKDLGKGQRAEQLKHLEDLKKLREDADAEDLKQLQEGGDEISNERARQIQEENLAYEEQSGKIVESSDRAAEAQIRNAERAGKAVADVAAQYDALGQSIDRVSARSGGPAPAAPAAAPSAPTADAPAASSSAASIVAALQSVQAAIVDALGRVERAERDTTNAVRQGRATGGLAG